ncbi:MULTISPECIES: threonine/serine dehydratase [unclassified Variovorax]|uniref:threonine/serine dehydratase n=1 Tax=unclassified Variovorax TaxID=663243 RepID=UPI002B22F037|nr:MULTISPECIES: threonine/serine dehydratase [unclassified Variovorax]MEB0056383.1 threonine/serine dehydratase [Variovorax sp. LG9.2]MEB0110568.1 threonine/serine dehydratase [Variovorax sp. RTB1]
MTIDGQPVPTLEAIRELSAALEPYVFKTPVLDKDALADLAGTRLNFKFELLQASGTFKARGAFSNMLALDDKQRQAGVTCVSAGNHAVAVAYAAMKLGIGAKVVMIKTASPFRVALCHQYGAEVVMADNGAAAFERVRQIEQEEGRFFVHPFNGYRTVLGTATLGYEWATQAPALDAVILPIGGGGLAAGVATAFKLVQPDCKVYGVEPEGADGMAQSFRAGHPIKMGPMQGIADSLMAPHTEAYSYELCSRSIDRLVTVSDDQIRRAMLHLFEELKLSPEPACAAATAGLLGPLREELEGQRVGVLLCGTNTDLPTLTKHLDAARAHG